MIYIEEATPSIYYVLSWLESYFKNHVQVSNPWKPYTPLYYIPNDTIYFDINLLSYKTYKEKVITVYKCICENDDLTEEETCKCGPSHEILFNFKLFNFDEFTKNENINKNSQTTQ